MLLSFQMLPEQPAQELLDAVALADRLGYFACSSADEIYQRMRGCYLPLSPTDQASGAKLSRRSQIAEASL